MNEYRSQFNIEVKQEVETIKNTMWLKCKEVHDDEIDEEIA